MSIIGLKKLCTPASVYLTLSMIALVVMMIQNTGYRPVYCLGMYECKTSNIALIFILKIMYVLFWTWILNLMCSGGYTGIAWFFVILPFLIFFIIIAQMMIM